MHASNLPMGWWFGVAGLTWRPRCWCWRAPQPRSTRSRATDKWRSSRASRSWKRWRKLFHEPSEAWRPTRRSSRSLPPALHRHHLHLLRHHLRLLRRPSTHPARLLHHRLRLWPAACRLVRRSRRLPPAVDCGYQAACLHRLRPV